MVGNAPDDPDALRRIAAAARGVDLFVTTGGVSVGEHDLVRGVLSEDGLAIDFWEIAMRPGKPLMFGHYRVDPDGRAAGQPGLDAGLLADLPEAGDRSASPAFPTARTRR